MVLAVIDDLMLQSRMSAAAKASGAQIRVVGFVSHVDAETIAAARASGIDEVLARGAFINQLPAILAAAASRPPGDAS